jgi:hypothetical protein
MIGNPDLGGIMRLPTIFSWNKLCHGHALDAALHNKSCFVNK